MKGGWYMIATALAATFVVVTTEDTTIIPIPTKCPRDNSPNSTAVQIAHETDCTKFYKCDNGMKILMKCPVMNKKGKRLHFNPLLQVCDWPARAGCKSGGKTIPATATTPIPATRPTRKPKPTKNPTPSPATKPKPASTIKPDIPEVPEIYCPDRDVTPPLKFPHPCSCEKYYLCSRGNLILRQCSNGYHWDEKMEMCVKASETNCIKKKTEDWYYN